MNRELWWGIVAFAALGTASIGARDYAGLAAPYYAGCARLAALGRPWQIVSVGVEPSQVGPGAALKLIGDVRRHSSDLRPAARVVSRVQVGAVAETPAVFWTMLLLWPAASLRQRLARFALGMPMFLGLEATTTAVQLIHSLPEASALLADANGPVTWWERWSRFLEAGGRFVVEVGWVLLTIVLAQKIHRARAALRGEREDGRCLSDAPQLDHAFRIAPTALEACAVVSGQVHHGLVRGQTMDDYAPTLLSGVLQCKRQQAVPHPAAAVSRQHTDPNLEFRTATPKLEQARHSTIGIAGTEHERFHKVHPLHVAVEHAVTGKIAEPKVKIVRGQPCKVRPDGRARGSIQAADGKRVSRELRDTAMLVRKRLCHRITLRARQASVKRANHVLPRNSFSWEWDLLSTSNLCPEK
jgi:hypothetical protein